MVQKLIVGLTGGFGSGKSTVAKAFRGLGAATIDADKVAHAALRKSSPLFKKIAALFPEALSGCGRYFHREKIAEKVFADPAKRERLEALVHPYVYREIRKMAAAAKRKVVIVEVPLLFEAGFEGLCDWTVVVTCKPSTRMARLKSKGFSPVQIKAREKAQMKESLKAAKADFVIDNSGSESKTGKSAKRLWERLALLRRQKPARFYDR
ncbi:MAG TPA: dephospho-CoA kinase [Candidatus Omnitrophota bacterium]|jgi:dephospho-CoA kinase|nr:dephospho-CoA kinase [Candidatus Omnitrophota bacterium]HQB93718.1 dephospho-CoA kinase [Candidatus Omnitrophota bacterium]